MHPAIRTPELLALIFSFLSSQSDRFRAVLVCRTWLDAALNELWHTITTLKNLLSLLYPLSEIEGRLGWVFCSLLARLTTADKVNFRRTGSR